MNWSGNQLFNDSQVSPIISSDKFNDTSTPNATADINRMCRKNGSREGSGLNVPIGSDETTVGAENKNNSCGFNRDEEVLGLLVIEPLRNVSHRVQHHPCESSAIQQALVTRIMDAQDLERNRNFFRYQDRIFHSFVRQRDDFELKRN